MKPKKKENKTEKKMTLRTAMRMFEKLDTEPAHTSDIVEGLNVILNSNDISHMSRKGLYNALRFMGENLDRFS